MSNPAISLPEMVSFPHVPGPVTLYDQGEARCAEEATLDGDRFDFLARSLSSRRNLLSAGIGALLAWLGGGPPAAAKRRACGKSQKRCGNGCIPRRSCCLRTHKRCGPQCVPKSACCPSTKRCGSGCIPVSQCCTDLDCGPRRLCARGLCVVGQGTCQIGIDRCQVQDPTSLCGQPGSGCTCHMSTTGQTRCAGIALPGDECGECLSDADCALKFPGVPGAFCVQSTGIGCGCQGNTYCASPCPT
jgi:hypothetical protein